MSAPTTLQQRVGDYLEERRRLGFKLLGQDRTLMSFALYVVAQNHQGPLSVELMARWARCEARPDAAPLTWARRIKKLRPLARYLRQFEPRTEVPDVSLFAPIPQRLAPHIYREEEIVALLGAARDLPPPGSLRPAIYETLFGLIAAAGLRVSEALNLLDADVDLKRGVLTARQSKFDKSRQLPLHSTTVDALQRYRRKRNRYFKPSHPMPPFFCSMEGQELRSSQVHRVFAQLRAQLGWVNRGAHHAPRIHDLRHTFAVQRMKRWYEQGTDIDQAMLALSTYLGHVRISSTYWYLSAAPELMALAAEKFEQFAHHDQEVNHV